MLDLLIRPIKVFLVTTHDIKVPHTESLCRNVISIEIDVFKDVPGPSTSHGVQSSLFPDDCL